MNNQHELWMADHRAPFLSGVSPTVGKLTPSWPSFFLGQVARPVRVLLIDDDIHVRKIIADELLADARTHLVAQGGSLKEGKKLLSTKDYDVLLVDLNLNDGLGFDLIRQSKAVKPLSEVILISVMEDEDHAMHAFSLGATGYYVKHSWFGSFPQAVLQVVNGGASITPSLARRLLRKLDNTPHHSKGVLEHDDVYVLSQREREVLKLVAAGYITAEISQALNISIQTVNTHIKNTHRKLKVRTRAQAVNLATSSGLL